jgi:hypothetical protein
MNNLSTAESGDQNESLLPYYVYVLLNPLENNKVFYVGKGTGQRAGEHERNLESLLNDEKRKRRQQQAEDVSNNIHEEELYEFLSLEDNESLSIKEREILKIKKADKSPLQVIVGRYETEDEAYAVEALLIHFKFGYENLTNIASGHGYKFIRTQKEFENIIETAKDQTDIPKRRGIDMALNVRNNEYRDNNLAGLQQAQAFDLLSELQNTLTNNGFNWRDFTQPGDKNFHPGISNGYLATIVRIGFADFNIQFTKAKKFSIQFIYTPKRPQTFEDAQVIEFSRLTQIHRDQLNISLSQPRADFKYSWLLPKRNFEFDSIDSLIKMLTKFKQVIESNSSIN